MMPSFPQNMNRPLHQGNSQLVQGIETTHCGSTVIASFPDEPAHLRSRAFNYCLLHEHALLAMIHLVQIVAVYSVEMTAS